MPMLMSDAHIPEEGMLYRGTFGQTTQPYAKAASIITPGDSAESLA
jgi:hypothetical protein